MHAYFLFLMYDEMRNNESKFVKIKQSDVQLPLLFMSIFSLFFICVEILNES